MRNLIKSSKVVLIVLPQDLYFDTTASALALAHLVSEGRKVRIGSSKPIPREFTQLLDFSNYKTINKLQRREVILSLNRRKGGVKAVRWREVQEKIQFIITPAEGDFEFDDVDLKTTGTETDLVIMVGCESLKSAGAIYESNPSFFKNVKILNIDINPKNSSYATVNKVGKRESLSSWVLELASQERLRLTKEAVDALFKGVLWGSEGFRRGSEVNRAAKQLVSVGGDLNDTISQLFDTLSVAQVRFVGKLISNMKVNEKGIVRSKIRHNEISSLRLDRMTYPEVYLLSRIRDYKVIIILAEQKKRKITARLYSHDPKINVLQLCQEYKPVGNASRAIFNYSGSIDDLEKKLLDIFGSRIAPAGLIDQPSAGGDKVKKEGEKKLDSNGEPLKRAKDLPIPIEALPIEAVQPARPVQRAQVPTGMTPPPPIQPLQPAQ